MKRRITMRCIFLYVLITILSGVGLFGSGPKVEQHTTGADEKAVIESEISYFLDKEDLDKARGAFLSEVSALDKRIEKTIERTINPIRCNKQAKLAVLKIDPAGLSSGPLKYVLITPDIDKDELNLELVLNGMNTPVRLVAVVTDSKFSHSYGRLDTSVKTVSTKLKIKVRDYKLWSPEEPNLYYLRLAFFNDNGKIVGVADERFGFRKFEARGGNFYLNNRKIFLRGTYTSAIMPDEVWKRTFNSNKEKDKREWMRWAWHAANNLKSAHFNAIYIHRLWRSPKTLSSRMILDLCDETGFLVIQTPEFLKPNWRKRDFRLKKAPLNLDKCKKKIEEQFVADWNHPSVVMYAFECERMDAYLRWKSPGSRYDSFYRQVKKYFSEIMDYSRKRNPTRLFTDSVGDRNFTGKSDYYDEHFYAGYYHSSIPDFINRCVGEHYFKKESNNRSLPVTITETCGMYLSIAKNRIFANERHGIYALSWIGQKKIKNARASLTYQVWGYKNTIEGLRRKRVNGVFPFTFREAFNGPRGTYSKPNSLAYAVKTAMTPVLVSFDTFTQRYFAGSKAVFPIWAINDLPKKIKRVKLNYLIKDAKGNIHKKGEKTLSLESCVAEEVLKLNWNIPSGQTPGRYTVKAVLSLGGKTLSYNSYAFLVYPKEKYKVDRKGLKVAIYDPPGRTRQILDSLGLKYDVYDGGSLKEIDLFIIGNNAIDKNFSSIAPKIEKFVSNPVRGVVLILEQDNLTSYRWFTSAGANIFTKETGIFPETAGYWRYNFADTVRPEHPVFNGLSYWDFNLWNDYDGTIHAGDRLPRSTDLKREGWDVLAVTCRSSGACLAERPEYILSHFMAVKRFGKDPIATKYLHNLLSYSLEKAGTKAQTLARHKRMEQWLKKKWTRTGGHPNMKLSVRHSLLWRILHKSPESAPHRTDEGEGKCSGYKLTTDKPIKSMEFDYNLFGTGKRISLQLLDENGKVLWQENTIKSGCRKIEGLNTKTIEFRLKHNIGILYPDWYAEIGNIRINGKLFGSK